MHELQHRSSCFSSDYAEPSDKRQAPPTLPSVRGTMSAVPAQLLRHPRRRAMPSGRLSPLAKNTMPLSRMQTSSAFGTTPGFIQTASMPSHSRRSRLIRTQARSSMLTSKSTQQTPVRREPRAHQSLRSAGHPYSRGRALSRTRSFAGFGGGDVAIVHVRQHVSSPPASSRTSEATW